MAFDTYDVLVGVYGNLESAEADYDLVHELHAGERTAPRSTHGGPRGDGGRCRADVSVIRW